MPPAQMFQDILEKTASKFYDRSTLLEHAQHTFTPFANTTFETERVWSRG